MMLFAIVPAPAQEDLQIGPEVVEEDYHDTSIPIREMVPVPPLGTLQRVVVPLRRRPWPPIVSPEPDAVSQNLEQGALVSTTNKLNFDGASANDDGTVTGFVFAPPDVPLLIIYVDSCPVCPGYCEWVMLETSRARRAQCGTDRDSAESRRGKAKV